MWFVFMASNSEFVASHYFLYWDASLKCFGSKLAEIFLAKIRWLTDKLSHEKNLLNECGDMNVNGEHDFNHSLLSKKVVCEF